MNFIRWYSAYFERFRLAEKERRDELLVSEAEGAKGRAMHALAQHNQILLSAIIMSAEDVLMELGRIGQHLEAVWLLEL